MIGVFSERVIANSGVILMARIVGYDGAPINQGQVNAITYQVRDIEGGSSSSEQSLAVGDVIWNTLQIGNGWAADGAGYNFRATLPASSFSWTPDLDCAGSPKSRRFQVDVRIVPLSGEPSVLVYDLLAYPTWIGATP